MDEQSGTAVRKTGKSQRQTSQASAILNQLFTSNPIETGEKAAGATPQADQTLNERLGGLQVTGEPRHQQAEILYIPIELLYDNPFQPRESINKEEQDYKDLVENIGAYGVKGSVPARKHPEKPGAYQLAWGHRRREAARDAGLKTFPITLEDLDDMVMAALAAIENVHRKDLNDFELGNLFKNMNDRGWSQEQIAKQVKKDRGFVVNRLRLVTSEPDIQAYVRRKPKSLRAVSYLITVHNPADRALLIARLEDGQLQTDDLAGDIDELLELIKKEEAEASVGVPEQIEASSSTEFVAPEPPSKKKEHTERDQVRIASAKFRRITNGLQALEEETRQRPQLSEDERNYLKAIGKSVKVICDRANIDLHTILEV